MVIQPRRDRTGSGRTDQIDANDSKTQKSTFYHSTLETSVGPLNIILILFVLDLQWSLKRVHVFRFPVLLLELVENEGKKINR
eukprot:gene5018-3611_t